VAVDAHSRRARRRALLRIAAAAAVLAAVFVTARIAGFSPSTRQLQRWADGLGLFAPLLYVGAAVALNCVFVPLPVLAGAAGVVFGVAEGTAVSVLMAGSAATVHMLAGRHLAGEGAGVLFGRRGAAVAEFLARRGFWTVLYVRLVPGIPFNTLNYAAGLSPLRARDMFAGTALGEAPRMFAYAALGGSISNLGSTEAKVAVGVGAAMAVVGALLARRQIVAERRRREVEPRADGSAA
jgi:uncharacterized membrane protein YdjX (TVP38/TMEM64 family)